MVEKNYDISSYYNTAFYLIFHRISCPVCWAVEYTDCGKTPPMSVLDYDTKRSSDAGALGNAEHSFIAIAPRSTQARNGSP